MASLSNMKIGYKVIMVTLLPLTLFFMTGTMTIINNWTEFKIVRTMEKNMDSQGQLFQELSVTMLPSPMPCLIWF